MKKKMCLLICFCILMVSMCTTVSASDTHSMYEFVIDDISYTVEFEDSNMSQETQMDIAELLIGSESCNATPANIWCDIFGHDLVTSTASVITHKVRASEPRCKKQTYNVTACEDCDYSEQTLLSTAYIYCCAAD